MKKMCVIVTLIGLATNSVFADRKGYAATDCLSSNAHDPIERTFNNLQNFDEDLGMSVWCPVVLNIEGADKMEARVRLINHEDVEEGSSCRLMSSTSQNETISFRQTVWPIFAGEHEIVIGPIYTQLDEYIASSVRLSCMIPKRSTSSMISYEIEQ